MSAPPGATCSATARPTQRDHNLQIQMNSWPCITHPSTPGAPIVPNPSRTCAMYSFRGLTVKIAVAAGFSLVTKPEVAEPLVRLYCSNGLSYCAAICWIKHRGEALVFVNGRAWTSVCLTACSFVQPTRHGCTATAPFVRGGGGLVRRVRCINSAYGCSAKATRRSIDEELFLEK